MYRQGLGDCFLLTCSDGDETSHLLIDCGVLKGTAEGEERMQEVAKSVRETTGGRLDRLVVTHEHWDHLSGFLQEEASESLAATYFGDVTSDTGEPFAMLHRF